MTYKNSSIFFFEKAIVRFCFSYFYYDDNHALHSLKISLAVFVENSFG